MLIQIIAVGDVVTKQGKKVPYHMFQLDYLTNGRAAKKQIMSFTDVYKTLLASREGEEFEITTESNREFTNWATAESKGVPVKASKEEPATSQTTTAKGATAFKSTYETPEERAKKQVYIVRQSCLAQAVAFQTGSDKTGEGFTTEDVLSVARQFEEYVFNGVNEVLDTTIVEVD